MTSFSESTMAAQAQRDMIQREMAQRELVQREFAERVSRMAPPMAAEFLLEHAVQSGASDLYFDTHETGVDISVRRWGIARRIADLPDELGVRCISHLQAESGIRSTDRRHPRTGYSQIRRPNGEIISLRLHVMPTLHGDSLAVRLLNRGPAFTDLDQLGFVGNQLAELVAMLRRSGGLILATGPSGCGKTTTLYACLHRLNDGRRMIHTVESPVEYPVRGFRQTQVDEIGSGSMAELLQGVMRHGPDVLMIGEVRDEATADVVVNAANSGRLVLATVNAPFAAAAIQRLKNLGVSPYYLSAALLGIVGQRLVRKLSPERRSAMDLSAAPRTFEEIAQLLKPGEGRVVYAAVPGNNGDDGYAGLTSVFEVLRVTPAIRRLIHDDESVRKIAGQAVEEGMLDLRRAALCKVAQGVTSFDEMQRIVPADETEWESR